MNRTTRTNLTHDERLAHRATEKARRRANPFPWFDEAHRPTTNGPAIVGPPKSTEQRKRTIR